MNKFTQIGACAVIALSLFALSSSVVVADDPDFTSSWNALVENGDMPGCAIIVATPTEILANETIGYADVASKTPMRDDSYFWIASNSKAIIATAAMICVDEGLLDLDAPLENYLPQLSPLRVGRAQDDGSTLLTVPASKPTLRQALSHTAGFRFITPYQESYGIDALPAQRLASVVGVTPLIDEPGKRYSYSNLGIDMAQAAVEKVSGKSIEEFLQERVFEPLEMNDTTFFPTEEQWKRLATPYAWDGDAGKLKPIRFGQMPSLDDGSPRFSEGGGGLFSSAKDFVKFFQMLGGKGVGANGKRVLSEKAVEIMSQTQTGEVGVPYGFGLTIDDAWFGHGGAYGTFGAAYRDGSIVAIYMVAVAGLPKQGEAERLARAYAEQFRNKAISR